MAPKNPTAPAVTVTDEQIEAHLETKAEQKRRAAIAANPNVVPAEGLDLIRTLDVSVLFARILRPTALCLDAEVAAAQMNPGTEVPFGAKVHLPGGAEMPELANKIAGQAPHFRVATAADNGPTIQEANKFRELLKRNTIAADVVKTTQEIRSKAEQKVADLEKQVEAAKATLENARGMVVETERAQARTAADVAKAIEDLGHPIADLEAVVAMIEKRPAPKAAPGFAIGAGRNDDIEDWRTRSERLARENTPKIATPGDPDFAPTPSIEVAS